MSAPCLASVALTESRVCRKCCVSASREMYRVTEGLQREKQSLMKQLDLLRYSTRAATLVQRGPRPPP